MSNASLLRVSSFSFLGFVSSSFRFFPLNELLLEDLCGSANHFNMLHESSSQSIMLASVQQSNFYFYYSFTLSICKICRSLLNSALLYKTLTECTTCGRYTHGLKYTACMNPFSMLKSRHRFSFRTSGRARTKRGQSQHLKNDLHYFVGHFLLKNPWPYCRSLFVQVDKYQ